MQIGSFRFNITARDELYLPNYKGSTFRGGLGHALRRSVCVTKMLECGYCMLKEQCAYKYIFDTDGGSDDQVTKPFVIEPPMTEARLIPPGDKLAFNLILFGKAVEYLPFMVHAFREVGHRGIGKERGRYRLDSVFAEGGVERELIYDDRKSVLNTKFAVRSIDEFAPEPLERIVLHFMTPTAIKANGRLTMNLTPEILVKNIIRRLKSLTHFHGERDERFFTVDWKAVKDIRVARNDLHWYGWQRYSARQDKKIGFDGVVGELHLEGPLGNIMPWLRLGELIHIGRGTVYGMGKYSVFI